MKIVISGSASLGEEYFQEWIKFWSNYGEVINYPRFIIKDGEFVDNWRPIHENFYRDITNADVLFIANADKNDLRGYIGYSAFAELNFAVMEKLLHGKNIRIVLANMTDEKLSCHKEIANHLKLGWIELLSNYLISDQKSAPVETAESAPAKKNLTLCLMTKGDHVLLGMKKRGFGQGRWNGFGGKLQPGESLEEAAKREVLEECGLMANNLEKVGVFDFEFAYKPEWNQQVHLYKCEEFEGEPKESEEMLPQWFHKTEIPFESMWPDDSYWFPLFLDDKKFKGRFLFGEGDMVLEHDLELVENF